MRRKLLIGLLVGSSLATSAFLIGWFVDQKRMARASTLVIAVHEPPTPRLVEPWAPAAEYKASQELYSAHGDERPASGRLMSQCKIARFTFIGDLFRGGGWSQAQIQELNDRQLNCLLAGSSKYMRVDFMKDDK